MARKDDFDSDYNPFGASKYTDAFCEQIIEMFTLGKTVANFCAFIGIGKDTFCKWRRKYERFDRAVIVAEQCARDYWDNVRDKWLVEDPDGKKMNWGAFNKMYSTRFNIPDKRPVKVKGLSKSKDERQMLKCLTTALDEEEITPDEAQKLTSLIEVSLKIKNTSELEDRLVALEHVNSR